VVFGTTVSGRPEEIEGVEHMVGLFINALPFRVEVPPGARAWSWLQEVQTRHLELRRYEHCSTGQVHQWSEVPGDQPLYESLLVYENYPGDPGGSGGGGASDLAIEPDPGGTTGAITRFALTLLAIETSRLTLALIHDRRRLEDADAALIGEHLALLLDTLAREPDPLLTDLLARLPAGQAPRFHALAADGDRPFVAPRTPTETALADIWKQILRVPEVSVLDNFLDLGGHSLMASEILARVNQTFQVSLPLLQLYETPTLEAMAAAVVRAQAEQVDPEVLARLLDELETTGAHP
jgi:non-ribosomal peptide synthetase component F